MFRIQIQNSFRHLKAWYWKYITPVAFWMVLNPLRVLADHTADHKATTSLCDNLYKLCNPIQYPDLTAFLLAVLKVVIQYSVLLIVFFLVYAGFQFVIAQGNSEKLQKARQMFVWIVIGAFVILGVYVIRAAICGTVNQLSQDPANQICKP